MKKCAKCGNECYDFVATCRNCGYEFPKQETEVKHLENNSKADYAFPLISMILGIAGMFFSCMGIGVIFSIAGLVLGIIALSKGMDKKAFSITGIVCSAVSFFIFLIFFVVILSGSSDTTNTEEAKVVSEQSEQTKNNVEVPGKELEASEAISGDTESKNINEESNNYIDKDSFVNSCEEVPYKTLARNPEAYVGTKLVLTVKVQQVMQGGLFDDSQYYRVNTDDEYGMWFGDEYFMYDFRADDNMKILQDDILKVYAEFAGVEEVTRALTGTTEEVPAIKAIYVELVDETEAQGVSEEVLNDGIIDIDFADFSVQYDSYSFTTDYEGNTCVIIYYNFTNNSSEPQSAGSCAYLKVFQNGIECESAFVINSDDEYTENVHKEVTSGTTIKVGEVFKINTTNELLLEMSEYISFNDIKDTMTLNITQ